MSAYSRAEQTTSVSWPNSTRPGTEGAALILFWRYLTNTCAPHNEPSFLASFEIPEEARRTVYLTVQERDAYLMLERGSCTIHVMAKELGVGDTHARIVLENVRLKGAARRTRGIKSRSRPGPTPWRYHVRQSHIQPSGRVWPTTVLKGTGKRQRYSRRNHAIRSASKRGATAARLSTYHGIGIRRIHQILQESE